MTTKPAEKKTDYGLNEFLDRTKEFYVNINGLEITLHNGISELQKRNGNDIRAVISDVIVPLFNQPTLEKLREKYPGVFLTQNELEHLEGIVKNNQDYVGYVNAKEFYTPHTEEQLVNHISQKIYGALAEEEKAKYKATDIVNIINKMPVMNLGIIKNEYGTDIPVFIKNNLEYFKDHYNDCSAILIAFFKKQAQTLKKDQLGKFLVYADSVMQELFNYKNNR